MPGDEFQRLREIMARLRAPDGCPWDREQSIASLKPYLIEEAYEVIDAIEREDWEHLPEELGDLQLQIVFQSQIASEEGKFTVDDVLRSINDKLIRRHPHVFDRESIDSAEGVNVRWDQIKAAEKAQRKADRGETEPADSILDDVPRHQPAMLEAHKVGKRAAKVGFDWRDFSELREKIAEEVDEVEQARVSADQDAVEDEIGDLLFMAVNMARHAEVNPELALRRANQKFRERFRYIEQSLQAEGRTLEDATLDEMEALWQAAKTA